VLLKKLGWWNELTAKRKAKRTARAGRPISRAGIIRVAMKNHGCSPFGNARARAVVWNFPDPIPVHREALYARGPIWSRNTRRTTMSGVLAAADALQDDPAEERRGQDRREISADPHQRPHRRVRRRRDESRSNPWLAELEQEAYVEITRRRRPIAASATASTSG